MSTRSSRVSVITVILLGVVVLVLAGSSATAVNAAANACKKVEGQVTVEPVSGECSSPYGCGAGTIKGDIKGTISVVTTSFLTSADTPTTGVVFMTADAVFTTSSGTLLTKDAITLSSTGGAYAEVDIIVGGTGSYAGATGTLTATGGSTAQGASGTYSGKICLP